MPEKKEKKTDFEKKMWDAKDSLMETAGKVGEKSKEVAWEIWWRWQNSDTAEKVCKIAWIVLIVLWLLFRSIRALILPLILIVLGILLVTGFFNSKSSKK